MTPDEFGAALGDLLAAAAVIVTAPLDEMTAYVENVEQIGAEAGDAFTAERQGTTAHVGRILAAATHLRDSVALGGRE